MTKVFVTVGTTSFPSLVRFFDRPSKRCEIVIQTADPTYKAVSAKCFTYTNDIDRYYSWADVIVTHAGAGSVYALLEARYTIVVVPNLERADKHQLELANYIEANQYAMVVKELCDYKTHDELIEASVQITTRQYVKKPFNKGEFLVDLLSRRTSK